MIIQPPFLQPDRFRAPFFDGMHEETASLSFNCQSCGSTVTLNVLGFLDQCDSWFRALASIDRTQIIRLFGCRTGKYDGYPIILSHDAGHPYFGIATCNKCQSEHLIYISFYEMQPARYIATFQGAASVGA